jgi:opacity protein-like surface antigen
VGVRGKYLFHASPTVTPYAGAGVGVHFLTGEASIPAIDLGTFGSTPAFSMSETETRMGFDLGGGLLFDVSPRVALQADAWYTIVSDFNQLAMRGGMMFKL